MVPCVDRGPAVVLVDARKVSFRRPGGIQPLVALLGIRHVVLAVTAMDLIAYSGGVSRHRGGIHGLRAARGY
jgi:sulfate adenylyltransferase subunit 1 (EFTu-like GTPase family)